MNLKDRTICIVDNGLFVDFARMLGREAKKAYYYSPSAGAFVKHAKLVVGDGFDELIRTAHPFQFIDEVDEWIFLDLYHWDWQVMLEARGKNVWGAREGEKLELHRWEFKQLLKKLGLPVQPMEHIIGLAGLREHLKAVKGTRYIKTSYLRGDMETWEHENYDQSEEELDRLGYKLGFAQHRYEFISEAPIPDAREIGYDGPVVDGQFPSHAMQAYEIKELGMFGVVKPYAQLAEPVRLVNAKLVPVLKECRYRGMISTEIRYTKDKKPYLIDPCCRLGSPSNELLQVMFTGWGATIRAGAGGELVSPKPSAKFGVLAAIRSVLKADGGPRALRYPEELDPWVMLRFHAKDGDVNYCVPQGVDMETIGFVAGTGNTLLAAVKSLAEHAKEIHGQEITINLTSIDKALDEIADGEKAGIKFTSDPLPTAEELKKAVG